MFRLDIAIIVETGRQPTTVIECYERALCAKFRLNQMKKGKFRRHEDREKKKGPINKVAIKPSSYENGQGSKKKATLSNLGSQRTRIRKRRLFVSTVNKMVIQLGISPIRRAKGTRRINRSLEKTSRYVSQVRWTNNIFNEECKAFV